MDAKRQTNRKTTWSNDQARRGGPGKGEGRDGQGSFLMNPVLHAQELIWRENGRAELREELLNPQVESLLVDPEIKAVVNHDSRNGCAGLLALDGFFVSLAIEKSGGPVWEKEVGATSDNQIVRHFFVKLGLLHPDGMFVVTCSSGFTLKDVVCLPCRLTPKQNCTQVCQFAPVRVPLSKRAWDNVCNLNSVACLAWDLKHKGGHVKSPFEQGITNCLKGASLNCS